MSVFPLMQIRDLHIAKREEDIGFYAGFVGRSQMLLFWTYDMLL